MHTNRPVRQLFIVPSDVFWSAVKETAQPLVRLGISMSDVAGMAGASLCTFDRTDTSLGLRGDTYKRVHHIEAVRQHLWDELKTINPEMLFDLKKFNRFVYSMIDCIANVRALLCEYARLHLGVQPPTLRLERFLGPAQDLVFSYEIPHPTNRPYENSDSLRAAHPSVAASSVGQTPYGL